MHSYGGSEDITKSMIKLNNLNIFFSLCLRRSAELSNLLPINRIIFFFILIHHVRIIELLK